MRQTSCQYETYTRPSASVQVGQEEVAANPAGGLDDMRVRSAEDERRRALEACSPQISAVQGFRVFGL